MSDRKIIEAKQLIDLLSSKERVKEQFHFKLSLATLKVDEELIIKVPKYNKICACGAHFKEDTISEISIYKWAPQTKNGEETFSIYIKSGNCELASIYPEGEIYISYDQYSNLRIEVLRDFHKKCCNPEELILC